jgi:DNA-binding XRE family transcriptional regulator
MPNPVKMQVGKMATTPKTIKELREHLQLTQEVFSSILGVSFATVNRWENGKTTPSGDYARVLQTLGQLTAHDTPGPEIDWKRVGGLSAMAAVAGFSPLLTLGAALAPALIAYLPSWSDVPGGDGSPGNRHTKPRGKNITGRAHISPKFSPFATGKAQAKAAAPPRARAPKPARTSTPQTGL